MTDTDSSTAAATDIGNHAPDTVHARYDPDSGDRPVGTVLEALGEAAGCPVDELDVRLHDAIDPDALNDLFRSTPTGLHRDQGHVSFAVGEFSVDVHADGNVFVRRTR